MLSTPGLAYHFQKGRPSSLAQRTAHFQRRNSSCGTNWARRLYGATVSWSRQPGDMYPTTSRVRTYLIHPHPSWIHLRLYAHVWTRWHTHTLMFAAYLHMFYIIRIYAACTQISFVHIRIRVCKDRTKARWGTREQHSHRLRFLKQSSPYNTEFYTL